MNSKNKTGILVAILILIVALTFSACSGKDTKSENAATPAPATPSPTPFVPTTASPESYADIKVPEGVYIIEAPDEQQYDEGQPTSDPAAGLNVPAGITIVDAPVETESAENQTSGIANNSGIYIVDPPKESTASSSDNSGIYIVDAPKESSSSASGNSGITIVDPPKESGNTSSSSSAKPSQSQSSVPVGAVIGSGTVYSNSGAGINIVAKYTATVASSTTVNVNVSVSLLHSALYSKANTLSISFGGNSVSLTAPSISYDGGSKTTYLGEHTFTVPLSGGENKTFNLSASWMFQGTYGGKSIPSLSCSESVSLSR